MGASSTRVAASESMAGQMDMARKALRALMVQKMLQSKQVSAPLFKSLTRALSLCNALLFMS